MLPPKSSPSLRNTDDPYCPENIPLFEAIYGRHLISLGGIPAIENMFSDLSLKNLKALDLGFGLGGVAFYLATHYQTHVSGVEIYPWMVEHATRSSPKNTLHPLEFKTYDTHGQLPYSANFFDIVYSKGVLNHVQDKEPLFRQVQTVLKPGGVFVIADWIYPSITTDLTSPLVCETKTSYEQALKNAGFHDMTFRDDSKNFLHYTQTLLENLTQQRSFIEHTYNKQLFKDLWQQHEDLTALIQQHKKYAVRIIANKSFDIR